MAPLRSLQLRLSAGLLAAFIFGLVVLSSAVGKTEQRTWLPLVPRAWPPPTPRPAPAQVLLSEVLPNPVGTDPDGEWIEIYNPGDLPFSLTGCRIGDEETPLGPEGMYAFPGEATLEPHQSLVIAYRGDLFLSRYGRQPDFEFTPTDPTVPDMQRALSLARGKIELGNGSDEVLFLGPEGTILDMVSWGSSSFAFNPPIDAAAEGVSLERYPPYFDSDSAGDWRHNRQPQPGLVDLRTPTPIPRPTATPTPTATPPPARLLISEFLYDPVGLESDNEWVEVFNAGNNLAYLDGYRIGDEETAGGGEAMLVFPPGSHLEPRGVVVVAVNAAAFYQTYGVFPDFEVHPVSPAVPDMVIDEAWGSGEFSLSNTGDELLLLGPGDRLVDSVSWDRSTWAFSPAVPGVKEGYSLERWPMDQDTDSAADWISQASPNPGQVRFPTPTPTNTPTSTPTPTSTGSPEPTATATATVTPTPTLLPTPEQGLVLISEVLAYAETQDPDREWIELYNPGGTTLDLSGFRIGDEETQFGPEGMYAFPPGAKLEPGSLIIIAHKGTVFNGFYGFNADFELLDSDPSIPNLLPDTQWSLGMVALDNTSDEVLLMDATGQLVDAISWGESTWAFNPSLPSPTLDHSFERCPSGLDRHTAADWQEQSSPSPGVPCLR